ncbi:signal transduction histidine kinase/phage shock protein PspC (stress-responsive transcriptional regulator) [Mycetocola sp. BIGb0189]|uniref:ATP-binding protein n=1 Tax=Mycetocola sp. BIGb0189 TaxID=2940604 RepID=UPI00216760D1|nr:ATP-binding protein [Mycetocola sp. BIGb0189]MCS4274977.1 signal transduction histidine kinase/phage shock protein PspC (stress-responsive transcriptional regulator) [Mycetocola sp. BIGb0189]
MRLPLVRTRSRAIAGVCAGLARHLNLPVMWVRVAMIALTFFGGAGALLYAWLWLLVPSEDEVERTADRDFNPRNVAENFARNVAPWLRTRPADPAHPTGTDRPNPFTPPRSMGPADPGHAPRSEPSSATKPVGTDGRPWRQWKMGLPEIAVGVVLLGIAVAILLEMLGVHINWQTWLPAIAIITGVGLTWIQLDTGTLGRTAGGRVSSGALRLIAGIALVVIGILILITGAVDQVLIGQTLLATFAILCGLAVVLAPWGVKYWRELGAERAARARESERADIAAHLHDSVLQTLALIQNRADSPADVRRLARAQERELRAWISSDRPDPGGSIAERLRGIAAEIEDGYGRTIEIVTVGDTDHSERLEPLLAATREAIQNAAKHATGTISVYLEVGAGACEVFVRDRGPGFDPDQVPEDRHGVRDSILGRMTRHGGTATLRNTGQGTEVALRMPLPDTPKEQV